MTIPDTSKAKFELMSAAADLRDSGVMFRGHHANLSARISPDTMLLTRGGNVANLDENSFALVRTDGTVIEGEVAPTQAEIIEMHAAVYRARPAAGSIIHTHAPHATVFSVAHQSIPIAYEPLVRFGITEPIPLIPWAPRGSSASVDQIVEVVKAHPGVYAVLLANHGVLAFAGSPAQTAQLLATVDEAAEVVLNARLIGKEQVLPEEAFARIKKRMEEFAVQS